MELKLEVIRGKRINDQLEEILTEHSTVQNLDQNIQGFLPSTAKRQYATQPLTVSQMIFLPYVGTKNLNITAVVHSPPKTKQNNAPAVTPEEKEKEKAKDYDTIVIFNDVIYEGESTDTNISFVAKDGKEYHMQPIELTKNTARVNCNCLDFFYRFKSYNAADTSLAGRAPPAYKKVPGSTRGPSNIKRVPGVCKHLLQTVEALRQAKMVT